MRVIILFCVIVLFAVEIYAGINRELKKKIQEIDPKVKSAVLGMKAQGVPKEVIADKIKMSVKADGNMGNIVDGIAEEDRRKRSPAAVEAKKREAQRDQAIKAQQRAAKRS